MYFSQLVDIMENQIVEIDVVEDNVTIIAYTGELYKLPFWGFRLWRDYEVLNIMPSYDKEEKEPYLIVEIYYAGGKKK